MASRINLPTLPKAVALQKSEPAATPRATPAQGARFQAQRALDAFQASGRSTAPLARLGGGAPGTVMQALAQTGVTVGPAPMTRAEREAAEKAIVDAHDGDPAAVAEWLRAHPDPAKQAAFMDLLFSGSPGLAGDVLNAAGSLPPEDQARVSAALNAAWQSGAITLEELNKAVGGAYAGAEPGETHEALAAIVAGTGNPALIEAYAKRELELMNADGGDHDPQRAAAVATALAGLPPDALQAFLKNNPDAMNGVLKNINSAQHSELSPALGKLLDAAARIQPPTAESMQLFMNSIGHIGENPDSRAAAARFFTRHMDALLQSMMDGSGSLKAEDAGKLSEFFTRTLFTQPPFEGQEAFRATVMQKLGTLQQSLQRYAGMDPMPEKAERQARMLGSLVGALEVGFLLAVDELKKRNDATKGMVDLFFSAKGLLPDLPIPGYGPLKDLTFKQIQEWVTNSLKEHPDDPEKAIPFHELFGEPITDPELRALYDSARLTALKNHDLDID